MIKCDLCVIGAGSGGLSVAAGAVQMGASVVLLEPDKMGGDCLNHGCVPSKALIAAGKAAYAMRGGLGVQPVPARVNFGQVKDHVANVIATIEPHDSQERFEALGVKVIREFGRFISDRELQAGDQIIRARRFVIATGSSPMVPPVPGLDKVPYETNETIFDLEEAPGHLLIIGGGPIGLEMGQAHRRLGSEVTVIEGLTALCRDDPELAAVVLEKLRGEGIVIAEQAMVSMVSGQAGEITVETGDGRTFKGSHLLIAAGRTANIDRLDLHKAEVKADRAVQVDARLRTTNRRIYAIGDVTGGLQFTHVAGYHAGVVIRSALFGMPAKVRSDHIPWVTFTDPELAQVGLTETQARDIHGDRLEVARFDFAGNDRALALAKPSGLIKVMVAGGRPVGASIVGEQAGELISVWALALANRLKMSQIAMMVAPYPTLAEINKRVAGAYFSPRLFDNIRLKRLVRAVQRILP